MTWNSAAFTRRRRKRRLERPTLQTETVAQTDAQQEQENKAETLLGHGQGVDRVGKHRRRWAHRFDEDERDRVIGRFDGRAPGTQARVQNAVEAGETANSPNRIAAGRITD